jgi:integrase
MASASQFEVFSRVVGIASTLRDQGQCVSGQEEDLSRRRYQKGRLFHRKGKRRNVWVGRWYEDIIEDGVLRRIRRSEVLGVAGSGKKQLTKPQAQRELEERLDSINAPNYRALGSTSFTRFMARWEADVLTQHKPSTRATIKGHLKKFLVPCFGKMEVKYIRPQMVQQFIAQTALKVSPKTVRNIIATFRMAWRSARAWDLASHDALEGIVLPKKTRGTRFFFSVEEAQQIIRESQEPERTFYWLAMETGMRAGELTGLRTTDVDVRLRLIQIHQTVWHGKVQTPKTENAVRAFAISPALTEHLRSFLNEWRPNEGAFLFATRRGTPWDANLFVKRKLHPLLTRLGIRAPRGTGLHAFRHTNSSLMDRLHTPLKVRTERLGHSDPKITLDVYTHVASEDDVSIATQLGVILDPDGPKTKKPESAAVANSGFIN